MNVKYARVIGVIVAVGAVLALAHPADARKAKSPLPKLQPAHAEGIAAVVNDQVISSFDVRMRSALLLLSSGIPVTAETMERVRGQALRSLVDERLEIQEAKDRKITASPDEVDRALAAVAKQNKMSLEQFSAQLKGAGSGVQTLRDQIEAQLVWRRLINSRYGSRVRISDVEIQNTMDRIKASSSKPQYSLSEILLRASTEKEFADAQTAGQRLLQELKAGRAPFAAVARQFSAAPSAAAGGDLGWLYESELRPELLAAVRALKPGQVSAPFRTPQGVEIIALREARTGAANKTVTQVDLRQILAPAASRGALNNARDRIRGCDGLERAVNKVPGAQLVNLGDTSESDLAEAHRQLVSGTGVGRATPTFDVDGGGVSIMVVCRRQAVGGDLPDRTQIENRMMDEELAMLSERYLMDLRRESTIITR